MKSKQLIFLFLGFLIACKKDSIQTFDATDSGGGATIYAVTSDVFTLPAPNLSAAELEMHLEGDVNFERKFVPSGNPLFPGLGPVFNNNSCASCHQRNGRGKPNFENEDPVSLLLRLSISGKNEHGGPLEVPFFGGQLQNKAIFGVESEGEVNIAYQNIDIALNDGEMVQLQKPTYTITNPYMPLPAGVLISPRIAMPVFGLGLLEAISEQTILSKADENDVNGDGISGKANYVWDKIDNITKIGRFGWKANEPTLLQQTADAFNQDMGITSFYLPIEASFGQSQADVFENDPEIDEKFTLATAFYTRSLGVPARRDVDNESVIKGKNLFIAIDCAKCHLPEITTGSNYLVSAFTNQKIQPFTDMLLHDMGSDLADGRPDFLANGQEWRTAPLWGIGLTKLVNGHTNFLHDGRARNLQEAILWHGGEAENAKNKYKNLTKIERQNILTFLESL